MFDREQSNASNIEEDNDNPETPLNQNIEMRNYTSDPDSDLENASPLDAAEGSSSVGETVSINNEETQELPDASLIAILRYIWRNVKDTKKNLAGFSGSILILILLGLTNVAGPFLISQALDKAKENESDEDTDSEDMTPLILLTIASCLIGLAKTLHAIKDYTAETEAEHVSRGLIKTITQNMLAAEPRHLSNITPAELGNIIQPTLEGIDAIFKNAFSLLPLTIETTVATAALFAFLSNPIFGAVFLGSVITSNLVGVLARKFLLLKIEERKLEKKEEWLHFNKETLEKLQTLKIYQCNDKIMRELVGEMRTSARYSQKNNIYQTIINLIQTALVLIPNISYLNFSEWWREYGYSNIRIEDITFVITYLLISIDNLTYGANYSKEFFDGYHKLRRSLKHIHAIEKELKGKEKELEMESFDAIPEIKIRLEEASEFIMLKPGTATALVGASGCGKSTIIRKLAGVIDDKNAIGIVINPSLKKKDIIYVSQHPDIYDRSLAYNIKLGLPEAIKDDQAIEGLLKQVCAEVGLSEKLKQNKKSILNDFSGGQKQLVGIARALIRYKAYNVIKKRRFVFIFDESTSALDNKKQTEIMDIIYKLRYQGNSIILIAHRLDSITACDNIVFLEMKKNSKGPSIIAQNNHENLYNDCERYQEFFDTDRWKPNRFYDLSSSSSKTKGKEKDNDYANEEGIAREQKNKLRYKIKKKESIQNSTKKSSNQNIYAEGNAFTLFKTSPSSSEKKPAMDAGYVKIMKNSLANSFQGVREIALIEEDNKFQIIFDSSENCRLGTALLYEEFGSNGNDQTWSFLPDHDAITISYEAASKLINRISSNSKPQYYNS